MEYNGNYPQWASEAVWYQIFPDRFCRSNDDCAMTPRHLYGTAPWNIKPDKPWQRHPWTSDWYAREPYERENQGTLKDNMLRRRYRGDINGIISKLAYLRDLGVTALYINPLQYSPSLHKYDGTNFLHTDPFLGSTPEADIEKIESEDFDDFDNASWTTADRETLKLISEAHKMGMKVMFDGVFNHIGYNSKPFQDVLKRREKSPYYGWFIINKAKSTPQKLSYEKFWGFVTEMPKLNYGCPQVRQYVFATLKRWLKPTVDGVEYEGIDGWRLDHAVGVAPTFWKSAYQFTKKINKNSLFLAELIEPESIIKTYLDSGAFDCIMNYGLYFLACEFFTKEDKKMSGKEFDKRLWLHLKLFKPEANYLAMNLLGCHDTERIASLIVNRKLKKYGSIAKFFEHTHINDRGYTSRRPDALERQIQRMMVVFEFFMIGAPMVYYGDELGMYGANDPDCRKPMEWPEMTFDDEHLVTGGRHLYHRREHVGADLEILSFYKKTIALRHKCKALSHGILSTDYTDPVKRIWIASRIHGQERFIAAFNCDYEPATITLDGMHRRTFLDYYDGTESPADHDGHIAIELPPCSFKVLLSTNTSTSTP